MDGYAVLIYEKKAVPIYINQPESKQIAFKAIIKYKYRGISNSAQIFT